MSSIPAFTREAAVRPVRGVGRIGLVFSAAALAAACGFAPVARVPFDTAKAPPGKGWYCIAHTPDRSDVGACYRSEAECRVEKEKLGASDACQPTAEAFCLYRQSEATATCYPRRSSCDQLVSMMAGSPEPVSECSTVL